MRCLIYFVRDFETLLYANVRSGTISNLPYIANLNFTLGGHHRGYSTVTLLAKLRGLSTSQPRATAM